MWEQARLALIGRYERDLASTQGQHRRFWKKVLRDRIKARIHRKKLVDDLRVRRARNPKAILPPPRGDLPRWAPMRTVQWRPHLRKYNQHQQDRMQHNSDVNRELRGKKPFRRGQCPPQSRSRSWTTWWEPPHWARQDAWWQSRDWSSWAWQESGTSSWQERFPPA